MKFAICNSLSSSLSSTTRSSQLVVANLLASICTCFLFNIEDLASVFKVAQAAADVVAVVIASVVAGNWSNNHANHS